MKNIILVLLAVFALVSIGYASTKKANSKEMRPACINARSEEGEYELCFGMCAHLLGKDKFSQSIPFNVCIDRCLNGC